MVFYKKNPCLLGREYFFYIDFSTSLSAKPIQHGILGMLIHANNHSFMTRYRLGGGA